MVSTVSTRRSISIFTTSSICFYLFYLNCFFQAVNGFQVVIGDTNNNNLRRIMTTRNNNQNKFGEIISFYTALSYSNNADDCDISTTKTTSRLSRFAFWKRTNKCDDIEQKKEQEQQPETSIIETATTTTTTSKRQNGINNNIFHVTSKSDCEAIVTQHMDKMAIIRFHSNFCNACKRITPRFEKLSKKYPNINFINVLVNDKSKESIIRMGIPSIPYGGIFHPDAGLVETINIKPTMFHNFEQIVKSYVDGECPIFFKDTTTNTASIITPPYLS